MIDLYNKVCYQSSIITTKAYSTSFSIGIKLLGPTLRKHIYAIYGFVRFADEIVDTFHDQNQEELFNDFKLNTYKALDNKFSMNPILHSFQATVNEFKIDQKLIDTFLKSMEMDLSKKTHNQESLDEYILGSAEVVGLMCLKVFCYGRQELYEELTYSAMKLGAAFQKVNFLRDLKADLEGLNRSYFPGINFESFTQSEKTKLINDIQFDFDEALKGIKKLPHGSRAGVYVAYVYYKSLLNKINKTKAEEVLNTRIRVSDPEKLYLLANSYVRFNLNALV